MKRSIYILVPAILLGGLIVWRFTQNKREEAKQTLATKARKTAPPAVRVVPAVQRDIVHTFQGVGNVESPADVRIAPKVTGNLIFLQVREGDRAAKGHVLAKIDPV